MGKNNKFDILQNYYKNIKMTKNNGKMSFHFINMEQKRKRV